MALNFSDSDKAKYMSGKYYKEIKLYFPELSLTVLNDEIYEESLELIEAIFEGNAELSIIGCISNRFNIEIRNQGVQLKNKKIQVSARIDGGSWKKIFTGYVESAPKARDRSYQKLSCYDELHRNEKKDVFSAYNALNFPVTIKTLRDAIFSYVGITQESVTLPNDSIQIVKTVEDGELAFIDIARSVCQINGVFGKVNANGVFGYKQNTTPSEVLPYPSGFYPGELYPVAEGGETIYIDKYRDGSISFEDYEVAAITGVTVRDGTSDTEYGQYGTSGNMLLIEGNILCRGLSQATKNTIAQNIYNKVKNCVYRPFTAANPGLPFVECGDAIAYYVYDYSSGEPVTIIMGCNVMSRYLKGIQWMTDTFSARGDEYQPEVKPVSLEGDTEQQINNIENNISNINNQMSGMSQAISSLQTQISYGTTDMTPGSTALATGNVYLMYE